MIGRYQCEEQKYVALLHVERQVSDCRVAASLHRCVFQQCCCASSASAGLPQRGSHCDFLGGVWCTGGAGSARTGRLGQGDRGRCRSGAYTHVAAATNAVLCARSWQRADVASCLLHVACRMMPVASCRLHDVCCMLHDVCCMLHVVPAGSRRHRKPIAIGARRAQRKGYRVLTAVADGLLQSTVAAVAVNCTVNVCTYGVHAGCSSTRFSPTRACRNSTQSMHGCAATCARRYTCVRAPLQRTHPPAQHTR